MRFVVLLSLLTLSVSARATPEEDAIKRLAAYYYKGSEVERRVDYLIGKIPVQLQLSLTYVGQAANVYGGGLLIWKKEFP